MASNLLPQEVAMTFDAERFRVFPATLWDYRDAVAFLNERGDDLLRSGPIPYLDASFQARLTDPTHTRISMIRERRTRRVVALAMLRVSYTWRTGIGEVEYVLVDEEFRGRGLGVAAALLEHLFVQAQDVRPRIGELRLVCEPDRKRARAHYERLGFRLIEGSDRHFKKTMKRGETL